MKCEMLTPAFEHVDNPIYFLNFDFSNKLKIISMIMVRVSRYTFSINRELSYSFPS